jgi:hypothetical protein
MTTIGMGIGIGTQTSDQAYNAEALSKIDDIQTIRESLVASYYDPVTEETINPRKKLKIIG